MVPFIYFCLYTCNISSKAQWGTNLKHKKYARETLFEAKEKIIKKKYGLHYIMMEECISKFLLE